MRSSLRTCLILLALCLLPACAKWISACAPNAELIEGDIRDELQTRPGSGEGATVDHGTYADLLEAHVDEEAGRVDYAGLESERDRLRSYLDRLASVDLTKLEREEQMAVFINAYNACTLDLILEHYPDIDSIKDVSNPWGRPRCRVGGYELTLDEIEHRILRPLYRDPRIHFAVNCASIGCPPLADTPYTGEAIDEQLDRATRRTLRDDDYVSLDDGTLHLNPILNWYRSDFLSPDFEGHAETIPAFVARYADESVQTFVDAHDGEPPVQWTNYDWRLNDADLETR
jgi:hypothetical protein